MRRSWMITAPRWLRWLAAFGWTLFLLGYLLQQPGTPAVEVVAPQASPDWQREIVFTIGHILGFGVLFVLWFWVFPGKRLAAAGITFSVGVFGEYLQSRLPERNASVYDIIINLIGICLAAWILTSLKQSGFRNRDIV